MRLNLSASVLCFALLAAAGCQRADAPKAATAPAGKPASAARPAAVPADDNLNAVLWVQTSAEYRAIAEQTYRAAADHLEPALRDKTWDALVPEERDSPPAGLPPAVILDVDETVLDNSPYQARLVAQGEEYDEVSWAAWVAEKKAKPVPGVIEFARRADALGITLLYVSNRAEHLQAATLANLRDVGLPVKDDSVFLGLGTFVEGCEQNGSEKLCRRRLAGGRYRVLMQFGDQLGDFAEVVANTPQGRQALYERHRDWFGERWWMLPNPTYGSWEPAAFNNDWTQPREARRAAKRAALDLSN